MRIKPQNLEEKLVWYTIIGTYGFYFLGLLFLWIPVVAWFLLLYLCKKLWHQTESTPLEEKITIPTGVWIWIASMLVMEFSLIMSHINLNLGLVRIIQSSTIGWSRTWAFLALFPLIGCLKIRPQLIYRAVCILCLQSLALSLYCYLAYRLHLPVISYISPMGYISEKLANGNVYLFTGAEVNDFRLNLFTDFANDLGLVGAVYFLLVCQESDKKLRCIGMISAVVMVVGSASRLTTLCVVIVPILTWILTNFTWPLQFVAGVASLLLGIFAPMLIDLAQTIYDATIKEYRSGSERARSKLKQIALDRWQEYPLWGHGLIEQRGPQSTGGAPIGTHNQWPDILYLKGIVGFIALIVPLVWSFMDLLLKAQKNKTAKVGLSIILLFFIFSAGGDLEGAAFYYWPGLVIIGMGFKEKVPNAVTSNKKYASI